MYEYELVYEDILIVGKIIVLVFLGFKVNWGFVEFYLVRIGIC